ncbi:MAG: hypothetical protein ACYCR4_07805 [Acidimicrobiales bacterium]
MGASVTTSSPDPPNLAALRVRRDEILHLSAGMDDLDFERRQRLMRLIVEQVRVTGSHVDIHLHIPLDQPPEPAAPGHGHLAPVGTSRAAKTMACPAKTVCVRLVRMVRAPFHPALRLSWSLAGGP